MDGMTDAQLVALAKGGDKGAYGRIVERYQNLICSLAFSSCGDVSLSEDLAQETFVEGWKGISGLLDAERLRGWLCGIAHRVVANHLRRRQRGGARATVPLHSVEEPGSGDASPGDALISREEDHLIWRSLESIPETYRTPLVLFYRQDRSVEEVARSLAISPEATRQRLSRGRSLLREKVAGLVERTLSASRPGKSFTVATLAALPALSTQAMAAGVTVATAKGTTVVKSTAALTAWGALLGPLLGLLGGYLGARAGVAAARSPRERRFLERLTFGIFALTVVFAICLTLLLLYRDAIVARSEGLFVALLVGLLVVQTAGVVGAVWWSNRRLRAMFSEERDRGTLDPQVTGTPDRPAWEYRSRLALFGLPLVHVAFGGFRDGRARRARAVGWIAVGDLSVGVLLSIGGVAVGGVALGGVSCGVVAFAGVAVGWAAFGGLAAGWLAAGGMALAWQAAYGGLAVAVDHAVGGMAIAKEANSDVAEQLMSSHPVFVAAQAVMDHSRWFLLLALLPLVMRGLRRQREAPRD